MFFRYWQYLLFYILIITLVCFAFPPDSSWKLVWSDEFNNRKLDTSYWNFDLGTGQNGWGNGELQCYTKENISFNDSCLIITLRKESCGGAQYTSSRIHTRKKVDLQYGLIQVRLKAPYSQAVWPAVWTLGINYEEVGWPACGEVDIFEMACGENYPDDRGDNANFAVVHYTDIAGFPKEEKKGVFVKGKMADDFHIFSMEWDKKNLSFYFDTSQIPYFTVDISKPGMEELHQPHSLVINMALGGYGFAGFPDATTVIPQYLIVDWIRWYQKKSNTNYLPQKSLNFSILKILNKGFYLNIIDPSTSYFHIFDAKGRIIYKLDHLIKNKNPGNFLLEWDNIVLKNGIYLINFYNGQQTLNIKFIYQHIN
jgi:beta-glucanase (GH16 family)